MSDFLRTFAASSGNSGIYSDKSLRWHQRLRRHCRSAPAYCFHSWKTSSGGFKLCSVLFLAVTCCLALLAVKLQSSPPSLSAPVVVKILPHGDQPMLIQSPSLANYIHTGFKGRRRAVCSSDNPCFVSLIADLDHKSAAPDKQGTYMSKLILGRMTVDKDIYRFDWFMKRPKDILGRLAEDGRGMELSELVLYNNSLYTFDDRTGIVFELFATDGNLRGNERVPFADLLESARKADSAEVTALLERTTILPVAKTLITESDDSPKGMKIEWASEKAGNLYIGSFGKEYTTTDGKEITGTANFWVAVMGETPGLNVRRENWTDAYQKLREATGTSFPGYLIHEAVNWSPYYRKWFFLPRRVSAQPYSESADERRGSNKMLIATETFDEVHIVEVAFPEAVPERGFSSFKFIPGTNDKLILALRSAEKESEGTQETFLSIFSVDGQMITSKEMLISDSFKFEGIEIW